MFSISHILTILAADDKINMLPFLSAKRGKEVNGVEVTSIMISFLISVAAGVIASFIYEAIRRWLNRRKK